MASPVAADSHDSDSTDEGIPTYGNQLALIVNTQIDCPNFQQLFKVSEEKVKLFDLNSRIGLNGSKSHCNFSCMQDEETKRFIVWIGDISIEKFTKTTFMNLVNFAEKSGCTKMILVQNRDHSQKGKNIIQIY
jgi:hypothetical protein